MLAGASTRNRLSAGLDELPSGWPTDSRCGSPPPAGRSSSSRWRARGRRPLAGAQVDALAAQLAERKPQSVQEEYEQQQRDMMQALQALKDRQSELEMADVRKNQFVATLAHELRNPLGTLQMTLHILRHKPEFQQPELVKHLAVIARQAQQINQLVTDLMDVSRVSQGKVELHKQPTDMNELVSQALEMTGAAMSAKKHQVDLTLHAEPLWVDADSTRLKQVLSNVMHNAARYSSEQGTSWSASSARQSQAVVEVEDQGFGIAPDLLPHVFGLFVQGATAMTASRAGWASGSASRSAWCTSMAAHLRGERGRGRGSRFTITLPLCAPRRARLSRPQRARKVRSACVKAAACSTLEMCAASRATSCCVPARSVQGLGLGERRAHVVHAADHERGHADALHLFAQVHVAQRRQQPV